ncbi:pimeloyl-ACP methyl ester carboxylesterase [Crossiella equi]|uniref:Pimeloyl-ACP methyl ester carboxylesterase n=1 Tax=Crossiella equi TaxID=130796 RepID=A0ABS5AQQ4_9PSEU|nr:alpha/beta hydrolase [Crossiella equi]MBP2478897.1 pimeloyl-ACP methyl ester carboxylesterase [Crossiella equi]
MGFVSLPDGRELFHHRTGDGQPTVVFEAGLAASRSFWGLVQPGVAEFATAVSYDRSGLGRSAASTGARGLRSLAADLAGLLDQLGDGPFVLVGHSWGGVVVRAAAALRPDRVQGLVLVDPTDELCDLLFTEQVRRTERVGQRITMALARLRLLGLTYRRAIAPLPTAARRDMRREAFTVGVARTRAAELASVVADLTWLREEPPNLSGIPVTVISGALNSPGMPRNVRTAATESHQERARVSSPGRHVFAPHSGHLVPLTDAAVVVEEVRRLVS